MAHIMNFAGISYELPPGESSFGLPIGDLNFCPRDFLLPALEFFVG